MVVSLYASPNYLIFLLEFIFSTISATFCFIIFSKTKESYDLTKYEGIKYFRGAFLFLGVSYILRFLLGMFFIIGPDIGSFLPRVLSMMLIILPLSYISTMGLVYLLFSALWKKFQNFPIVIVHIIAIGLSLIAIITNSHLMLTYLQLVLSIIVIIVGLLVHKEVKTMTWTKMFYFLITTLWLINLFILDQRLMPFFWIKPLFQIISIITFGVIYHKLSKWVK